MKRALILLIPVCLGACTADSVVLRTEHGVVVAGDARSASQLSESLAVASKVKAALASSREDLPLVRCVTSIDAVSGANAVCAPDHIEIREDALALREYLLAHELAHWYMVESPYEAVPYFIEEGIAEYVALELLGWQRIRDLEQALYRQSREARGTGSSIVVFYIGLDQWVSLGLEERYELMELALDVVRKLGLERVRELSESEAGVVEYIEESKVPLLPAGFDVGSEKP